MIIFNHYKLNTTEIYAEKRKEMLGTRRAAKTHSIYYVYLIRVDNKLNYYGVTADLEKRIATHRQNVDSLIRRGISVKPVPCFETQQHVHYTIAAHLLKSKMHRNANAMQFHICYQATTLEEAQEVESFLIMMAKKSSRHCCNIVISKKKR